MSRIMRGVSVAILACAVHAGATASDLVKVVVPFGAGGVQDSVIRLIGNDLSRELGANVIVENRAGAGGMVGTALAAKGDKDGGTLLMASSSHNVNAFLYSNASFDAARDFAPVAFIGETDSVLLVSASVPVKTFPELVAYAKANPGKLNYGSGGNGSTSHLQMAYIAHKAGLDMVHVPFRSAGDALNEVIAGRVEVFVTAVITARRVAADDRVRILAVTAGNRSPLLPGVPSFGELGVADHGYRAWLGLLAPSGISEAAVTRINGAVNKLLAAPDVVQRLADNGITARPLSAEAFSTVLAKDRALVKEMVELSGARQ